MQTKMQSLIETVSSIAIGFVIALAAQSFIMWVEGIEADFMRDIRVTVFFTVISLIRSYYVRRLFNRIHNTRSNHDATIRPLPSQDHDRRGSSR